MTAKIRVGVLGSKGKMGQAVLTAISTTDDLECVAQIDLGDSLDLLTKNKAEVVIDFTQPDSVMGNLDFAIKNGIHCVVGTTGFNDEKLAQLNKLLAANPKVGVLVAPNFGLGAAAGAKFLTKNGFVGEIYVGAGRLFGSSDIEVYPRAGITIGKRF